MFPGAGHHCWTQHSLGCPVTSPLEAEFELLAIAELPHRDALILLRKLHEQDAANFPARAYVALGSAVVRLISARRDENLHEWNDVIRQASAFVRGRGDASTADKLLALSDMALMRARFARSHPVEDVIGRPHFRAILEEIRHRGGRVSREELKGTGAIAEAYLAKFVANLEMVGLVRRSQDGGVRLTAEGERALESSPTPAP